MHNYEKIKIYIWLCIWEKMFIFAFGKKPFRGKGKISNFACSLKRKKNYLLSNNYQIAIRTKGYRIVMKINQELFNAIEQNDLESIKNMEKKTFFGIRRINGLNARNQNELTPLAYALKNDKDEIAVWLIEHGANIRAKIGERSLFLDSIEKNKVDVVRLLIYKGVNMNQSFTRHCFAEPALIYAIRKGFNEIAKIMISKKAKVNTRDSDGYSPLLQAVINNDIELATLLVNAGADINARNIFAPDAPFMDNRYSSKTSLMIAKMQGYQEIVNMLIANGAK